jgi:DNA-binding response OmpR family regulator
MTTRVLVIDDEPDIVLTLRMILELEGFEVLDADSAERALTVIAAEHLDAIILDISLPDADGWWLLERIAEEKSFDTGRVVVVTAHVSPSSPARASRFGAAYVAKPFRSEDVLAAVAQAAAKRETVR